MGHSLRLLVGPEAALRPFLALLPEARLVEPVPGAPLLVLAIDDERHDTMHEAYGTGEWLDAGPRLTSTDMAFCAAASRGAALAYIEIEYFAGEASQSAVLWRDGQMVIPPATLDVATATRRPRALWPVNAALRGLGVVAQKDLDEFTTFGLDRWRSSATFAGETGG